MLSSSASPICVIPDSPIRDRSPFRSSRFASTPVEERSSSPILPPPPEFTLCFSPAQDSPLPWLMSESDSIGQEVEIHSEVSLRVADSRESSQELEPFFQNRRIVHNIAG